MRGLVYVDRANTGVHVLELAGRLANSRPEVRPC
jgi:hypothetical protein